MRKKSRENTFKGDFKRVQGNLYSFFNRCSIKRCELGSTEYFFSKISGDPYFNAIFAPEKVGSEYAYKINKILHDYTDGGLASSWWVPSTQKGSLVELLSEHGYKPDQTLTAMTFNLKKDKVIKVRDSAVVTSQVTSLPELREWVSTFNASYSFGEKIVEQIYQDGAPSIEEKSEVVKYYIGRVNNIPVATGILFFQKDTVGIYHISVHPEHRGKGVANALFTFCLSVAQASDKKYAVLQSTAAGKKLYINNGFKEVGTLTPYLKKETVGTDSESTDSDADYMKI